MAVARAAPRAAPGGSRLPLARVAQPPGPNSDGVTDGFPTQAAADAMSSGCLLVSANPAGDRRVLQPGATTLECAPDPEGLRQLVLDIADEPPAAPGRRRGFRPSARADGRQAGGSRRSSA